MVYDNKKGFHWKQRRCGRRDGVQGWRNWSLVTWPLLGRHTIQRRVSLTLCNRYQLRYLHVAHSPNVHDIQAIHHDHLWRGVGAVLNLYLIFSIRRQVATASAGNRPSIFCSLLQKFGMRIAEQSQAIYLLPLRFMLRVLSESLTGWWAAIAKTTDPKGFLFDEAQTPFQVFLSLDHWHYSGWQLLSHSNGSFRRLFVVHRFSELCCNKALSQSSFFHHNATMDKVNYST